MSKIITCHCNRPDILELQLKTCLKNCKDLEGIIVINDGLTKNLRSQIYELTNDYKQICWNSPLEIDHSSPSVAVSGLQQWAYDKLLNEKISGKFAFFDGDLLPVKEFKIKNFLQNHSLAGLKQTRDNVEYLWPGFLFMDIDAIPRPRTINWSCGVVECKNVDTLGLLHHHFKELGKSHVNFLYHTSHLTNETLSSLTCISEDLKSQYKFQYKIEVMENSFIHYGRSSGWDGENLFHEKLDYVKKWLTEMGALS